MKKIVLAIMFVLLLTGCDDGYINDTHKECAENGGTYIIADFSCDYSNTDMSLYYTQEEVDLMLQEIYDGFEDIESNDGYIENTYVSHSELESKNYVEESYLWADFYDSFGEDISEYMEEYYQPIDECDSDCMIDRIDREIIIMTIAQIDIILYGLENSQEPLTDEEQYVLDLYTALRALMYLELEEE